MTRASLAIIGTLLVEPLPPVTVFIVAFVAVWLISRYSRAMLEASQK